MKTWVWWICRSALHINTSPALPLTLCCYFFLHSLSSHTLVHKQIRKQSWLFPVLCRAFLYLMWGPVQKCFLFLSFLSFTSQFSDELKTLLTGCCASYMEMRGVAGTRWFVSVCCSASEALKITISCWRELIYHGARIVVIPHHVWHEDISL